MKQKSKEMEINTKESLVYIIYPVAADTAMHLRHQ